MRIIIILLLAASSCTSPSKETKSTKISDENSLNDEVNDLLLSLESYDKSKDLTHMVNTNLELTKLYNEKLKNYEKALDYSQKVYAYYSSTNDRVQIAKINLIQSEIYAKKGNIDEARLQINTALKYYREIDNRSGMANALLQLSKIEYQYGVPQIAELSFEKAKEIQVFLNNKYEVSEMNTFGLELYRKLGRNDKAQEIEVEQGKIYSKK